MGPLHLSVNTDQAHILCRCARATPPTNHYHYLAKASLQMRRLQRGHDAKHAAVTRPKMDKIFILKSHVQ